MAQRFIGVPEPEMFNGTLMPRIFFEAWNARLSILATAVGPICRIR